jgi:BolA protein
MTTSRVAEIRSRLEAAFTPDLLEIVDESHRHAGPAGATAGEISPCA